MSKLYRSVAVLILSLASAGAWSAPLQRSPARLGMDEADTNAVRDLISHDMGNLRMTFANRGELGNPVGTPGFRGLEFPFGSGNEFLFSAGIWVGARRNGVRLVSTTSDGDNGTSEFWPEHIGSVPGAAADPDWHLSSARVDSANGRRYVRGARGIDDDGDWLVTRDDRDGNGLPSVNWDGGRGWIGIDDDADGLIDEETANFADDDGDGMIDEDTDETGDANGDGNCLYDPEPFVDEDPPGDMAADWQDNDHDGLVDSADPDFDGDALPGSPDDDGDGFYDEDASAWGDQEYFCVYQDDISPRFVRHPDIDGHTPLNVAILQRSHVWQDSALDDFVIVEYVVRNRDSAALDSVFIGVFADPDIMVAGGWEIDASDDHCFFDSSRIQMVQYDDMHDFDGAGPGAFAVRLLHAPLPLEQLRVTFRNFDRVAGGDPATNADKYNMIASGTIDPHSNFRGDWRILMAFGSAQEGGFTIAPGAELRFVIAYLAASDTSAIGAVSDVARRHFLATGIPLAAPREWHRSLPAAAYLIGNFPNPFNPATMLRFALTRSGDVHLAVYNALGQEVRTLIRAPLSAGTHHAAWDGTDDSGRALSSGIYFARLNAVDCIDVRKLVMLR